MTKREKAILWRWPFLMFVFLVIVYSVALLLSASFYAEIKSISFLWWDISIPGNVSVIFGSWWGNIIWAPYLYLVMLSLVYGFELEIKELLFYFFGMATFFLYIPFGKDIIIEISVLLSFLFGIFVSLSDEGIIIGDFGDQITKSSLYLTVISLLVMPMLFYPFGVVFLFLVVDIVVFLIGSLVSVILIKIIELAKLFLSWANPK